MSLAQAFQTAAAYRQSIIDQNNQAAMQTPMLAVQALSVGLQAQAQQQDMQFKMQSMVLQTQLQIEETKTKQAMQLMEFDLKSRQLNANEQIARKQLDFERMRTDASVAASDMQRAVAKAQLDKDLGMQVADTALSQLRSVYTNRQLYSGAADQDIQMLGEKNPVAANFLREKLIAEKRAEALPVLGQIDQLERQRADRLREDTRGMSFREATIARQRINADFDAALAPLREDATLLTGRNLVIPSQTSLADLLTGSPGIPMKDRLDALAEIRQTMSTLDPVADKAQMDSLRTRQESLLDSFVPLPRSGAPKKDPLGDELGETTAAPTDWGSDPEAVVKNAKQAVATASWDSFEKTKVADGIMPVLTAARAEAVASGSVERVKEVDKLKLMLDAVKASTLRGITGSDFWRTSGPAKRAPTDAEVAEITSNPLLAVAYAALGTPGDFPRVGGLSQRQMESFPVRPTYAQVKALLESLEVKN